MIRKVIKRDGRVVNFEKEKIVNAIYKAGHETGEFGRETASFLANIVITELENEHDGIPFSIELIQNKIETVLMRKGFFGTAKAFILYREHRREIREIKNHITSDIIDEYLGNSTWEVHENANVDYSIQGLKAFVAGKAEKMYWLNKVYPRKIANLHKEGWVHIHNLSFLGAYCVGWDLEDLIKRGFGGVPGKPYSKPAKHLSSILGQMMNFLFTLQNEAAGAVAFSSFDTYLAPFVYFDKLSYKEVKQQVQEFVYNMNQTMRTGGQSPFSNITLDIHPHPLLKDRPVIVGGKEHPEVLYRDMQKEMDMVNRAFWETMIEGDGNGRPFTFPIPTINIDKDFDWENPELEPMWEATRKYGTPYFANFVNSDLKPEDARSMCLEENEEVIIKNPDGVIEKHKISDVVNNYKRGVFDKDGWANAKNGLKTLSLNFATGNIEWANIINFLRIKSDKLVEITTDDGKVIRTSSKHIVPVFGVNGLENKFARDVEEGDYLLSLKNARQNLKNVYQHIGNFVLDEDLAKILGYFVADGNYLFENRKGYTYFGQPRGMQFTFNSITKENLLEIRSLVKKVFNVEPKEKKDPRYNSYYLYIYSTSISRTLYNAGFKKYGKLPSILFNSPPSVIEAFLEYHFKGDGYKRRQEIHINDTELSRDLIMLYNLIGIPVTYRENNNNQVIYIQHKKSETTIDGRTNNPLLFERVPGFLAESTYKVPGLVKSRMVGVRTLEKYDAETEESRFIKNSDFYLVRVKSIKVMKLGKPKYFYDFELDKNHLFVHSMGTITHNCCRLRLNTKELKNKGGGLFGAAPLTGSIGVITINMPRIGYLSKTKEEFFDYVSDIMEAAKDAFVVKRKTIEAFTEAGLYPYSKIYLEPIKKSSGHYWDNHFSTIGVVGMNEALLNFMGKNIGDEEGIKFAVEVLNFMREKMQEFQEETGSMFNLEATPSESTSYELALKDKELYPDIIVANEREVEELGVDPFYTNSAQLPVDYTDDPFEVAEKQNDIQRLWTGGTVIHFFLGESLHSGEEAKVFIKKIVNNFEIPYITITPTFSICPKHGYIPGEHEYCPYCDAELAEKYAKGEPSDSGSEGSPLQFNIDL